MPPRKRAAAAKPRTPKKPAKAAPKRVAPVIDDPDRARRAAEYAEKMGPRAARPPAPVRHCPTCTCGPK